MRNFQITRAMIKNVLITDKLRVAITDRCNLSCFYCHNEGQRHGGQGTYLSLDYVKAMCKWFRDNGVYVQVVNITGGEPLLHKDLDAILSECDTITKEIHLNTNATLLNRERIVSLKKCGAHDLKVGIDSLFAPQTKPSLCISKARREDILDNIQFATSIMGVELNAVLTRHNYKDIDMMIDWAYHSRVRSLKIIQLNDFDPFNLNGREDSPEEYKTNDSSMYNYFFDVREKYLKKAYHYDWYPSKGRVSVFLKREDESEFELLLCEDVCSSAACGNMFTEIDSNGRLMLCPRYHRTIPIDFNGSFDSVAQVLRYGKETMCNSFTGKYTLRNNHGEL